jgi:hypothetical protein
MLSLGRYGQKIEDRRSEIFSDLRRTIEAVLV